MPTFQEKILLVLKRVYELEVLLQSILKRFEEFWVIGGLWCAINGMQ